MLDDFVDVTRDEKRLMHLWNSFVRKQRLFLPNVIFLINSFIYTVWFYFNMVPGWAAPWIIFPGSPIIPIYKISIFSAVYQGASWWSRAVGMWSILKTSRERAYLISASLLVTLLKVLAYVHDFDVGLLCDACSLLVVFCFYRWLDDIIHGWIFVHKSVSIKVWITDVGLILKLYKSRPYLLSFPMIGIRAWNKTWWQKLCLSWIKTSYWKNYQTIDPIEGSVEVMQ